MSRKKMKWEPICHWCKDDMEIDEGWRTPLWSGDNDSVGGFLAGIVVCSPHCRARPEDAVVYNKEDL